MTDNELRDLRLRKQLPAKEIVEVVRTIYPKFDKPLLSKCENGGVYGVQLRADAMKALRVAYCPENPNGNKVSRHGKHRLSCCVSARLENTIYEALQRQLRADGYTTVQDLLTDLVRKYLKEGAANDT